MAIFWLTVGALGCAPEPVSAPSGEPEGVEGPYLRVLSELTSVLEAGGKSPGAVIDDVRAYVSAHGSEVSEAVNALNRGMLAMPEGDREAYRRRVSVRVEGALESFSSAQLRLHRRMDEAQKYELSEALSLLR